MIHIFKWGTALFLIMLAMTSLVDALEEISAHQVVDNITQLLENGDDMYAEITITQLDASGNERKKQQVAVCRKDYPEAQYEYKLVVLVREAGAETGSGLLSWHYDDPNRADDQWLYTSIEQKIIRIAINKKRDNFMGTDLTYVDIGDWDIDDYTYTHLEEPERIEGTDYHIEALPKEKEIMQETGYSRIEIWIRSEIWRLVKAIFYDKEDPDIPVKELTIDETEHIQGIWTPMRLTMKNLEAGGQTVLKFEHVRYNTGIDDYKFAQSRLSREEPCFSIE